MKRKDEKEVPLLGQAEKELKRDLKRLYRLITKLGGKGDLPVGPYLGEISGYWSNGNKEKFRQLNRLFLKLLESRGNIKGILEKEVEEWPAEELPENAIIDGKSLKMERTIDFAEIPSVLLGDGFTREDIFGEEGKIPEIEPGIEIFEKQKDVIQGNVPDLASDNARPQNSIKLLEEFYSGVFDFKIDFSAIPVPKKTEKDWGKNLLLGRPAGLKFSDIFKAFDLFSNTRIGISSEIINAFGKKVVHKGHLPQIYDEISLVMDKHLQSSRGFENSYLWWGADDLSSDTELVDKNGFGLSAEVLEEAKINEVKIKTYGLEEVLIHILWDLWVNRKEKYYSIKDDVAVCADSKLFFEAGEETCLKVGGYNGHIAIGRYSRYKTAKNIKAHRLIA